jgi:hypothetical protein
MYRTGKDTMKTMRDIYADHLPVDRDDHYGEDTVGGEFIELNREVSTEALAAPRPGGNRSAPWPRCKKMYKTEKDGKGNMMEKYRRLRPIDIIRKGDQYMCDLTKYPYGAPTEWTDDSASAGLKCNLWSTFIYRRPVSKKEVKYEP